MSSEYADLIDLLEHELKFQGADQKMATPPASPGKDLAWTHANN